MFTDLVSSTEPASRLGHDDYETFRQRHFSALRAVVAAHDGVEIKSTGDGLMLSFGSTTGAVRCAVGIQQATENTEVRIGVSSGEATEAEGDLYGLAVVEAARLCAAASAGQILVSDVVRLLARGKGLARDLIAAARLEAGTLGMARELVLLHRLQDQTDQTDQTA